MSLIPAEASPIGTPVSDPCDDWCTYRDQIIARMSGVEFLSHPLRRVLSMYEYTAACLDEQTVHWRLAVRCIDAYLPSPPEDCANGAMTPPRWARLIDIGNGRAGPWLLQAGF